MSHIRFFADFGSTFTKLVALDTENAELLGRAQAPSTVETDIMDGLEAAFAEMRRLVPVTEADIRATAACSSAAGGLRMLCIGLVPDYTTEAGRLAALGAGAKVVGEYSYELSRFELEEIAALDPDIILLTGGTDGGNSRVIVHNARMLAESALTAHIVAAGNIRAQEEIREAFRGTGHQVYFTDNVMPTLGKLWLEPVNRVIRQVFLSHIVEAKGIARVNGTIAGIRMPTPSAVFEAAKLLANGVPGAAAGLGDLLLVDVGGATTDVYSVCDGRPTNDGVELVGMEEPYAKRTVEGDLGLYHNLETLARIADNERILAGEDGQRAVETLRSTRSVPTAASEREQLLFTRLAVKTAVDRHAGRLITDLTPHGLSVRQRGKDLSKLKTVIGSGGPVAFSPDPRLVLEGAAAERDRASILKPKEPRFYIDGSYILFAVGLLAEEDPAAAYRIAEGALREV